MSAILYMIDYFIRIQATAEAGLRPHRVPSRHFAAYYTAKKQYKAGKSKLLFLGPTGAISRM
jgi:hypothetical protein